MSNLTILIPAAGAASRMQGGDKLLELVGSNPMLRHQAILARKTCPKVIVTLRPNDDARRAVLKGLDVTILTVTDSLEGMSASVRAGARAAKEMALMILPADMPNLTSVDLQSMIEAVDQHPTKIIRATAQDGTPGHPVIFPPDCLADLAMIAGDEGGRSVLHANKHRVHLIALPDQNATTDLDTPEDWAAWRATKR